MVTVKVFATYRRLLNNQKQVVVDLSTPVPTRQVLDLLFDAYPGLREEILDVDNNILPHVSVFAHGRDVRHKQGLDTPLHEGEILSLFPPVAGG
jgi:molybdopterin synthase sulfur carrier subunit